MFDHISIGVSDLGRARRFYDGALAALGYPLRRADDADASYGGADCIFILVATEQPVPPQPEPGTHFCFTAPSRAAVDAFHRAALAGGGRDHGAPGLRPEYRAHYYAAFAIDPDGYRIEAYCGRPE